VRDRFEQRLGALYSLFAGIESTGLEQTSEVIRSEMAPNPEASLRLGLDPAADLFRLDRVRLADGSPLAIDQAWLPPDLGKSLLDADFSHTALYDELETRCQCRPDSGWERITPVVPDPDVAEVLGMPDGEAAFQVERLGRCGDRDVEWRITIIRGDRYRFFADWSAAVASAGGLRFGPSD